MVYSYEPQISTMAKYSYSLELLELLMTHQLCQRDYRIYRSNLELKKCILITDIDKL